MAMTWFRCPLGAWPSIAETLTGLERQWTEEEAAADLSYFAVMGRVPGRRELASRWKWSEWATRRLLRSTAPPIPASNVPPATPAESVQGLPLLSQDHPTPLPAPSQAERVQANNETNSAHDSPTPLPGPSHSSPSRARSSSREKREEIRQASFEEAAAFWGEQVNPKLGRRCSRGPSRSSADGKKLWKALEQHPERVMKAMRWVASGSDDFMRRRSQCLESVLRHREKYADFWDDFGSSPDPTASKDKNASPAASWGHHPQPEPDEVANNAAYEKLAAMYGEEGAAK